MPNQTLTQRKMTTHDFTLRKDGSVRCVLCGFTDDELRPSWLSCEEAQLCEKDYFDEFHRKESYTGFGTRNPVLVEERTLAKSPAGGTFKKGGE